MHIGVPLLLVFGLWFHVQRISRAAGVPAACARARHASHACSRWRWPLPVLSHAPADLSIEPGALALDWIVLFVHPLGYAVGHGVVWALLGIVLLWLLLLPWLQHGAPKTAGPGAESTPHPDVQAPLPW